MAEGWEKEFDNKWYLWNHAKDGSQTTCGEEVDYYPDFRAYVCVNESCPNWGLYQTSIEGIPSELLNLPKRKKIRIKRIDPRDVNL